MQLNESQDQPDHSSLEKCPILDPFVGRPRALAGSTNPHSNRGWSDTSRRLAAFMPSAHTDRHSLSPLRDHRGMRVAGARTPDEGMAQQHSQPAPDVHLIGTGHLRNRHPDGRGPGPRSGSRGKSAKDILASCGFCCRRLLDLQSLPLNPQIHLAWHSRIQREVQAGFTQAACRAACICGFKIFSNWERVFT